MKPDVSMVWGILWGLFCGSKEAYWRFSGWIDWRGLLKGITSGGLIGGITSGGFFEGIT